MPNPLRSEEAAFRFLMWSIGYLGLIAVGSVINTWLRLGVFLVETAVLIVWLLRARRNPRPPEASEPPGRA